MWAGILSVPPLISWYLDHFPSIHAQMPAWAGFASLSAAVGLAIMALVANAVAHANLDRLLRDSGRRPLEAPPQSVATTPETEPDHSLIDGTTLDDPFRVGSSSIARCNFTCIYG
jgi:hypothetical protein